jgi:hypothetical protein
MKGILALTTSLIWQNGDSKFRIIECCSRIKEGVLKKKVWPCKNLSKYRGCRINKVIMYLICFGMFSDFYQLHLHNGTCVALANIWWSISKNRVEYMDCSLCTSCYQKRVFVDSWSKYVGPLDCVDYWVVEWLMCVEVIVHCLLDIWLYNVRS